MFRKLLYLAVFCWLMFPKNVLAQQSGRVYEFLSLPLSARITSLGGFAIPSLDADVESALFYPSLLNPEVNNFLSLNFVDYFSDINYGTVAFAQTFGELGTFSASVQYINYGRFTETDITGQEIGHFSAGEYSFMAGWGRPLSEHWSIGTNLKLIYSSLHDFNSLGIAVDVSFTYVNPDRLFAAGLVARNAGRQIVHFNQNRSEPLPFDLVFGASKKLPKAPLRFSLAIHNLHRFDLTYTSPLTLPDPNLQDQVNQQTAGNRLSEIADKVLRHIVIGAEFLPTSNFAVRFGYNYRRRQELKVDSRVSTVGFSWGFGIRISRFHFSYGRSTYHLAGAPNHITVSTRLSDFFNWGTPVPSQPQAHDH
ncbi:MAG TPA: type IX secretion system protein PorQ [Bacteroidales bacterium]|nr:type IX secretion system protein PorQ [Bacteroidales bacterium]